MNILSLFSGVGGMDRGLELAGHTVVGMCEIDPKARSVLRRHWPDVPIHDDVSTLDAKAWHGRVDLVAGGSPCQDLSVAGRRAGLDGERSGLFWHQCRIAAESGARWVLWENVAGALSSNDGEDFAAVLWGLTGCRPAVPEDGWRSVGVCVGPDRTAVWRLLDARWFGVAQRRRRVFVVAGPRDECGPEILLEPESCGGDLGARPTAGRVVAGQAGGRSDKHRRDEFVGSLTAMDGWERPDNAHAEAGWLVPVAISENQRGEIVESDYAHQLTTGGGKPGQGYPAVAYPLAMRGRGDGAELEMGEPDTYNSLRAGDGGSSRQQALLTPDLAVRRLTPRECERLMGWPDDWTRWDDQGNEIADSHRYRMCGNGVVAPVAEWIARRLP